MSTKKKLPAAEQQKLLSTLQVRFEKNKNRHEGIEWSEVVSKLKAAPDKLWSLYQMEETGGEPDIIGYDKKTDTYTICDCSAETPAGRRSLCYDHEALESRKENKPAGSALAMAYEMGITVLSADEYTALQQLGNFDCKTSSWVLTPPSIRALGGALFGDKRYNHVFIYHNGASSYYAVRGFRGLLKL